MILQRICQTLETYLKWVLAALLVLMVVDVTWQVLTRFILANPSSFTEELARYLLVWIGLLGASYAYRTHAHLGIDILVKKFHGASRTTVSAVAIVFTLSFALLVMVKGGASLMALTFQLQQTSAALNIPMGFVYSVIPLSGILIALFAIEQLWQLKLGHHPIQQTNQ